tara:strand:+ start:503 stop:703 length:201 start_codon:yes stop_codon:yes gene_type:complete
MELLDRLNKELITIIAIAGLLFTSVFIALSFLVELQNRTDETEKANDRQNGYNIYKVLDGSSGNKL